LAIKLFPITINQLSKPQALSRRLWILIKPPSAWGDSASLYPPSLPGSGSREGLCSSTEAFSLFRGTFFGRPPLPGRPE